MVNATTFVRSSRSTFGHVLPSMLLLAILCAPGAALAQGDLRIWHRWWVEADQLGQSIVTISLTLENRGGVDFQSPLLGSSEALFLLCAGEPMRLPLATISSGSTIEHTFTLPCRGDPAPLLWSQPLMFHIVAGGAQMYVLSTAETQQ